jgi:hypothetical protein
LPDEIARRAAKTHSLSPRDPPKDLLGRGARYLSFEDLLDVIRESLSASPRAPHEFAVQTIGNVSHLDHLRHVASMSHVSHMVNTGVRGMSEEASCCSRTDRGPPGHDSSFR